MLISEFETLTGIYPSEMLYSVIEEFYNDSKTDKHEFCRRYMMNAKCLAERIQTVANELESTIEQKNFSRIGSLEAKLEAEKKRADMLQQELDKEQNISLEEYQELGTEDFSGIPPHLSDLMRQNAVLPSHIEFVSSEIFKYFPKNMKMQNYPADYFDYLVNDWANVFQAIQAECKDYVPF